MDADKTRVLLVDDDAVLRGMLERYLAAEGYRVCGVGDGAQMRDAVAREAPAVIILDWMLPGEDGLSLAHSLRDGDPAVIMLSARGDTLDRILALESGVDDYLPKPFEPRELLARIRAVLRRKPAVANAQRSYEFGAFRVDLDTHRLIRDGITVPLTTGEFTLLHILVRNANRVLSRDDIVRLAHENEHMPFDRSIDMRVARLRRRIENNPEQPCYIRTVWGSGYLFTPRGSG